MVFALYKNVSDGSRYTYAKIPAIAAIIKTNTPIIIHVRLLFCAICLYILSLSYLPHLTVLHCNTVYYNVIQVRLLRISLLALFQFWLSRLHSLRNNHAS